MHMRRRCNRDGTYDSSCLSCFLTVARHQNEFDSERLELLHVCSGVVRVAGNEAWTNQYKCSTDTRCRRRILKRVICIKRYTLCHAAAWCRDAVEMRSERNSHFGEMFSVWRTDAAEQPAHYESHRQCCMVLATVQSAYGSIPSAYQTSQIKFWQAQSVTIPRKVE